MSPEEKLKIAIETIRWVQDQCGYASPWWIKMNTTLELIDTPESVNIEIPKQGEPPILVTKPLGKCRKSFNSCDCGWYWDASDMDFPAPCPEGKK